MEEKLGFLLLQKIPDTHESCGCCQNGISDQRKPPSVNYRARGRSGGAHKLPLTWAECG